VIIDEERAESGKDGDADGGVEDLFCGGCGSEEFATKVGGVAAGAGDGGMAGAGADFRFAEG
jgi:hypothetical protein